MSPKNTSPRPESIMIPPSSPTLAAFWKRMYGISTPSITDEAMHWAATQALFTHTCVANDAAGFSL